MFLPNGEKHPLMLTNFYLYLKKNPFLETIFYINRAAKMLLLRLFQPDHPLEGEERRKSVMFNSRTLYHYFVFITSKRFLLSGYHVCLMNELRGSCLLYDQDV